MERKEEHQTILPEYETKQVGLNTEAYSIIREVKNALIKKHKKHFTFSDAIIALKNSRKGSNIEFTKAEVAQIKTKLGYKI